MLYMTCLFPLLPHLMVPSSLTPQGSRLASTSIWQANSSSAIQEIPKILWNMKVHSCVHKNPPLVSILFQINSVHASHLFLWERYPPIYTQVFLVVSSLPVSSLKSCLHLSPMSVTWPAHLILLDLINLIILGEQYKQCSYLLCSFVQFPITSPLLGPNILLSTLFSNTLSLCLCYADGAKWNQEYRRIWEVGLWGFKVWFEDFIYV
jgi:hypothetical protein